MLSARENITYKLVVRCHNTHILSYAIKRATVKDDMVLWAVCCHRHHMRSTILKAVVLAGYHDLLLGTLKVLKLGGKLGDALGKLTILLGK